MALDKDPILDVAFEACPELEALADMAIAFSDNPALLEALEEAADAYARSVPRRQPRGA